jgi:hypothetical protein
MIHTPTSSLSPLSGTGGPGAAATDVDDEAFTRGGGAGVCRGRLRTGDGDRGADSNPRHSEVWRAWASVKRCRAAFNFVRSSASCSRNFVILFCSSSSFSTISSRYDCTSSQTLASRSSHAALSDLSLPVDEQKCRRNSRQGPHIPRRW